jgi:hypothetical protein
VYSWQSRGITKENATDFVKAAVLNAGGNSKLLGILPDANVGEGALIIEPLEASQIFVCCHGSVDLRCGSCGPILVTKFREFVKTQSPKPGVWPTSHIGGHKFAGNVIAYTKRTDGSVAGDWSAAIPLFLSLSSIPSLHILLDTASGTDTSLQATSPLYSTPSRLANLSKG